MYTQLDIDRLICAVKCINGELIVVYRDHNTDHLISVLSNQLTKIGSCRNLAEVSTFARHHHDIRDVSVTQKVANRLLVEYSVHDQRCQRFIRYIPLQPHYVYRRNEWESIW